MKRNGIALVIVASIICGLILLNSMQPDRITDEREIASERMEDHMEEAARIEQQYAQANSHDGTPDAAPRELPPLPEDLPELAEPEPNVKRFLFQTTKGNWVIDTYPEWAPLGVARFEEAVEAGVYNDAGIFRVLLNFVIQFGIPADPKMAAEWKDNTIPDDTVRKSNERGTITFATSGPNSRTTQVFINMVDNRRLDQMGFAPFGKVVHGMDLIGTVNDEYGQEINQGAIQAEGSAFLRKNYPDLDYVLRVTKIADTTG